MPVPYSDNLYSSIDSDNEDVDAHNHSPTDGYFHASSTWGPESSSPSHQQQPFSVPYIPNVLVEDPSLPANKAREAEAERISTGQCAGCEAHHTHHHQTSIEEDFNVRSSTRASIAGLRTTSPQHPIDAPPAYTPSPSSASASYRTFPAPSLTMRLQEEQQQPLLSHEPQSMGGDPPGHPKPQSCRWQRVRGCATSPRARRWMKCLLGVLLVILVLVLGIGGILFAMWKPKHNLADHDPVRSPDMRQDDLVWDPSRGCLNQPHYFPKTSARLDLRHDRNLHVIQATEDTHNREGARQTGVWGDVVVRAAPHGSPGTIDFEVISNHEHLQPTIEIDYDARSFKIVTPLWVDWEEKIYAPCMKIRVTVWIPTASVVDFFFVKTVHLGVDIKQGLVMGVLKASLIETVVGNVTTPQAGLTGGLGVPYTIDTFALGITTVSGHVSGWYPLYTSLIVGTASGNVDLNIAPKPVDLRDPWWAAVEVTTVSGNIDIQELLEPDVGPNVPHRRIPPREYTAQVETVSGNVTARLAWSSMGEFISKSGDMYLRLWPVLHTDLLNGKQDDNSPRPPTLKTDTKSGDVEVTVLEPWWTTFETTGRIRPPPSRKPGEPDPAGALEFDAEASDNATVLAPGHAISMMRSEHKSVSGHLVLRYPEAWEGVIIAKTVSGPQIIRGEGVDVSKWRMQTPSTLKGKKGEGSSELKIDSVSGYQDVLIGKDVRDDDDEY